MRIAAVAALAIAACSSRGARAPGVAAATADGGVAAVDAAGGVAFGPPIERVPDAVWRHGALAADDHVCALRRDGRVLCWGQNNYGEVGDQRAVPHAVPIVVPGVRDAIAIDTGPSGTCAVVANGRVWCWGSFGPRSEPALVGGVGGADEVAVASVYRCARRRDGAVWCWNADDNPTQVAPIDALAGARRLVAGHDFVCAIVDGDGVRCARFTSAPGPGQPAPPPVWFDVHEARGAIQLAAFFQTTCAVLAGGTVQCWEPDPTRAPPAFRVWSVPALTDAVDLVAGLSQMCAARLTGGAVCFGSSGEPVLSPADHLRGFRAVALATSASCGERPGGERVCWGHDYGPLGRHPAREAQPTPVDVPGVRDAVEIAVEDEGTCARDPGGRVTCWGDPPAPRRLTVRAERLLAGRAFTCAIARGKTSCWGTRTWNDCRWDSPDNCQFERLTAPTDTGGLLGIAGAIDLADPCVTVAGGAVRCRVGQFHDLATVELEVGGARSLSPRCAVDAGGAVACWWITAGGDAPAIRIQPIAIVESSQVVSGLKHACALATRGQVWCWGDNRVGELGDGTRVDRQDPAPVADLTDVVELAAGDHATCARTAGGAVWCWGSNADGALGDGSGRDQRRPVQVVGLDDAVEVRAHGARVCARRATGAVACWGHRRGGELQELTVEQAVEVAAPDPLD